MKETWEGGRELGEQGGTTEGETRRDRIPLRHHPSPLIHRRIAMCHPRSPLLKAFSLLLHCHPHNLPRCFPLFPPRVFAPPRMSPHSPSAFLPTGCLHHLKRAQPHVRLGRVRRPSPAHARSVQWFSRLFPRLFPSASLLPPHGHTPSHSPPRAANFHSHHLPPPTPPFLPSPGLLPLSLLPCQPSCWVT